MLELLQEELPTQGTLRSGVIASDSQPAPKEDRANAADVRYLFNPFIIADCRELNAPVGHLYLYNGKFLKIQPVTSRTAYADMDTAPVSSPLTSVDHDDSRYYKETRLPGHIVNEMMELYAGAGLYEIKAFRAVTDNATVGKWATAILGDVIPSRTDIFDPQFPCPNLPVWFEHITENVRKQRESNIGDKEILALISQVAKDLRAAFVQALKFAQTVAQGAKKRMIDPDERNKVFSPLERRSFLALGEEIPDQMPMVTHHQYQNAQPQPTEDIRRMSQRLDDIDARNSSLENEVTRLRAENAALRTASADPVKPDENQISLEPVISVKPDENLISPEDMLTDLGAEISDPDFAENPAEYAKGETVLVDGKKGLIAWKRQGRYKVEFSDGKSGMFDVADIAGVKENAN